MTIQVLLDPKVPGYGAIQPDLLAEMNALGNERGVKLTTRKAPPPEGTLPVAEAFQFIVEHKEEIVTVFALAKAVIQVVNTILSRRQPKAEGKQKLLALVLADDQRLPLPASPERQRKFLAQLEGAKRPPRITAGKRKTVKPQVSSRSHKAKPRSQRK